MCFNHPWRPAYARCSYCKRPFCYADLVENGKQQYCFEDLSHATDGKTKYAAAPNLSTYTASILFLISSLTILYYIAPQIQLITIQVAHVGPVTFLNTLTYSSEAILLSVLFATTGFLSSIIVLKNSVRGFLVCAVMLFATIIFFSYQYISTTSTGAPNYFLYVTLILFATMFMLALSRIGFVGRSSGKTFTEQIEWPKLETF